MEHKGENEEAKKNETNSDGEKPDRALPMIEARRRKSAPHINFGAKKPTAEEAGSVGEIRLRLMVSTLAASGASSCANLSNETLPPGTFAYWPNLDNTRKIAEPAELSMFCLPFLPNFHANSSGGCVSSTFI